jgi:hypothetical protein
MIDGEAADEDGLMKMISMSGTERRRGFSCGLPRHALSLGHRPRVAGSVYGDGVRREPVEVGVGPRVGVRDQGQLREDVIRNVIGLGEIEVTNRCSGERDR